MGMMMMRPGPLAHWRDRPRRKITPRSYSFRILMALMRNRNTSAMSTKPKVPIAASLRFLCYPAHPEFQVPDRQHFNGFLGGDGLVAQRLPVFAVDEDSSFGSQGGHGHPPFPHQALGPANDTPPVAAENDARHYDEKEGHGEDRGEQHSPGDSHTLAAVLPKQHDGPQ